jgi:hypothetical protein
VPLLSRGIAGVTGIPLGLLVLLAFYVLTLRRAVLDRRSVANASDDPIRDTGPNASTAGIAQV